MADTPRKHLPGLLDEPLISFYPSLAVRTGANKALILQQVHFLTVVKEQNEDQDYLFEGRYWVYNTYKDWQRKHFPWLSTHTIKQMFQELEEDGILLARPYEKDARTKYYAIDDDYWPTWFAQKSGSKTSVSDENRDQKPPQLGIKNLPILDKSGSKTSANTDQKPPHFDAYKESENNTEIETPEITLREQTPSPSDSEIAATAGDGEGCELKADGDDDGKSQNPEGGEVGIEKSPPLPQEFTQFRDSLHPPLSDSFAALPQVTQIAWWHETKIGDNPPGLLRRLMDQGLTPSAPSQRYAHDLLDRLSVAGEQGIEAGEVESPEAIARRHRYITGPLAAFIEY